MRRILRATPGWIDPFADLVDIFPAVEGLAEADDTGESSAMPF